MVDALRRRRKGKPGVSTRPRRRLTMGIPNFQHGNLELHWGVRLERRPGEFPLGEEGSALWPPCLPEPCLASALPALSGMARLVMFHSFIGFAPADDSSRRCHVPATLVTKSAGLFGGAGPWATQQSS